MTEDFSGANYFQHCKDLTDKALANYYYMFLQYWIIQSLSNYNIYDKYVFVFSDNELKEVQAVKLGTIVLSIERTAWLNPSENLDSKYENQVTDEFSEEFRHYEEEFCDKIKHHWAFTPLSDAEFLVTISKESFNR